MDIITREDAIKNNQKWFFTGEPCKNGHIDKKSVSRWLCYECSRIKKKEKLKKLKEDKEAYQNHLEKKKEHYKKNFDKISQKVKEKYPEVREERQKYLKDYYQKNKEKLKNKASVYFLENKEKVQKYKTVWNKTESGMINSKRAKANRRAKEKRLGSIKKSELISLLKKTNNCYWCGCLINKKISGSFHFDHYIPIAKNGLNSIENIVVSCPSCNMNKKAKDPIEFANSIGKLL